MNEPVVSLDVAHQDHDMPAACGRHPGCRRRAGEFPDPIRGQIELRPYFSEQIKRCFAAAESTRATVWPAAQYRAAIGIDRGICLSPFSPRLTPLIGTTPHVTDNRLALLFVPRRRMAARHEHNRKRN